MSNFNCFDAANKIGSVQLANSEADLYEHAMFVNGHGGFNLTQVVDPASCRLYINNGVVVNRNIFSRGILPAKLVERCSWRP
jgi:hypothetical protein